MQKINASKNKKKTRPRPVYKPYLRGNLSALALRRGLRVSGPDVLFAFFGVLTSSVLSFDNMLLRIVLNGALLFFGCMLMFNDGARFGESDVAFAEIALRRQEEGKARSKTGPRHLLSSRQGLLNRAGRRRAPSC